MNRRKFFSSLAGAVLGIKVTLGLEAQEDTSNYSNGLVENLAYKTSEYEMVFLISDEAFEVLPVGDPPNENTTKSSINRRSRTSTEHKTFRRISTVHSNYKVLSQISYLNIPNPPPYKTSL